MAATAPLLRVPSQVALAPVPSEEDAPQAADENLGFRPLVSARELEPRVNRRRPIPKMAQEEEVVNPGVRPEWRARGGKPDQKVRTVREGEAWLRFTHVYYWGNALSCLSYFAARAVATKSMAWMRLESLGRWEQQAGMTLAMALAIKFWRRQSVDSFIADVFLYAKAVIVFLTMLLGVKFTVYYMVTFFMLFVIASQPRYRGPDRVQFLNPTVFEELVTKGDKTVVWIIEFFAPWSPPCIHLEPVVAELSLRYTTPTLKFAKVDVGRWPALGKDHHVNPATAAKQLPTFIMFEEGKETARIPHLFEDGSVAKGRFRKEDLIKGFELDMRFTRSAGTAAAKAAPAAAKQGGALKKKQ